MPKISKEIIDFNRKTKEIRDINIKILIAIEKKKNFIRIALDDKCYI